jgi:hypothetical protein
MDSFECLEDVKDYCERAYNSDPPIIIDDCQIAESQVPPHRTFVFKLKFLPPLDGLQQAKELNELKRELEQLGFRVKLNVVKNYIELYVEDKADPNGPEEKFRVKGFVWDRESKEFVYSIYSENDDRAFSTVSENYLREE